MHIQVNAHVSNSNRKVSFKWDWQIVLKFDGNDICSEYERGNTVGMKIHNNKP